MEYSEYLKTDHWKKLAEETKRLAGYRCQVCNSDGELHAHHRTYERKGDELQSDLICLCKECHAKFHGKNIDAQERIDYLETTLDYSWNLMLKCYEYVDKNRTKAAKLNLYLAMNCIYPGAEKALGIDSISLFNLFLRSTGEE